LLRGVTRRDLREWEREGSITIVKFGDSGSAMTALLG
jgi:hypothetical protein